MSWLDVAIKALWSIIFLLLIVGIFFLPVTWLRRKLRIKNEREHRIIIHHKANFRAFYYLAVEAPQYPNFVFRLMAGNLPLANVSEPADDARVENVAVSAVKATGKSSKTASTTTASSSQPFQQKVANGGSALVAKTGTLANLLGALAGLLPGSLGKSVRAQQEGLRQAQVNGARAAQAPKQAQQRMTVLQSESRKLGVNSSSGKQPPSSVAQKVSSSPSTVISSTTDISAHRAGSTEPSINSIGHSFQGLYCARTVELDPEQTLPLKLIISSATRHAPVGSFAYNVYLQAVPFEHLQEKIPVVAKHGMVYYAPVAAWRSFISGFANVLMVLLGLLIWFYSLTIIW